MSLAILVAHEIEQRKTPYLAGLVNLPAPGPGHGEYFLHHVRDTVADVIRTSSDRLVSRRDLLAWRAGDEAQEIADAAPDTNIDVRWAEFTELRAWQTGGVEYAGCADMTCLAGEVLRKIALSLIFALIYEVVDEY